MTGSDKIFISVTALGSAKDRKISSRSNAEIGYKVIVSGEHGNSAKGLEILQSGERYNFSKFVQAHLMPVAQREFSKQISLNVKQGYAMMDSSDGLADALMQIAKMSGVRICVQTEKIPHDQSVEIEQVLYGGEDYQLVAAVDESLLQKISGYTIIGEVKSGDSGLEIDGKFFSDIDDKLYKHFEDKDET